MNKKTLTSIILIFIFSSAFSQKVKTNWGDLNKNEKKMQLVETFGSADGGDMYSILTSNKPGHLYIEKYSGNAKMVFNKELDVPTPKEAISANGTFMLNRILYLNNVIYLFTSYYDKKADTRYLYVSTISKEGELNNDTKKLDEVNDVKKREGNYSIICSDDSTKLCIYNPGHYEKNEKQKLFLHVIDLQLKDLWNKEIQLPYPDKLFNVENVKIDNEGNAFISGSDKLKGEEAKGKFDYKYVLVSYLWQTGAMKEYNIDLGDKYMNNFYYTIDKDNNIRASGFYANKKNDYLNGYFYLLIDTKGQVVSKKIVKDFDANFLKNFPKKSDLKNVVTQRFYVADNGSLNIIAEQNYIYVVTHYSQGHSYTVVHYCSNHIIVLNMNQDGKLNWEVVVPKYQDVVMGSGKMFTYDESGDPSKAAYSIIMPYKNSIYFAYNDVLGNSKKDPAKLKKYSRINKNEMVIVKVDEKGKVTKDVLDAPDKKTAAKTFMVPVHSNQISPTQYSFVCRVYRQPYYRISVFDLE